MKLKKGFTLIELLIVIVIIGILAVIVVGLVATNARNRANDAAAKAEMREVQTALEQYFIDNEEYPAGNAAAADGLLVTGDYLADQDGNGTSDIDISGSGYVYDNTSGCYSLSYTLQNTNDTGPGVTGGVYTLNCKQ